MLAALKAIYRASDPTAYTDGQKAEIRMSSAGKLLTDTTVTGLPAALGATTMSASTSVTIATDDARIGIVTETAPATDTASSGLNGRLQRIAQRLTSLIALLPSALGANGGLKIEGVASGTVVPVTAAQLPASLGSKAASASTSVVPAGYEYETVAASQTAQALGGTGATGDFLSHVILQPTATNAGTTTILDNATVIYTFTTGTLSDLRPITVPINAFSVSGAWKITTGASITATAFGDFAA